MPSMVISHLLIREGIFLLKFTNFVCTFPLQELKRKFPAIFRNILYLMKSISVAVTKPLNKKNVKGVLKTKLRCDKVQV